MKRQVNLKGSFTVEAAFLTPVFLLVIFTAIHLQLHMFEKAWDTAVLWEEKVTQATEDGTMENEKMPAEYIQRIRMVKGWAGKD